MKTFFFLLLPFIIACLLVGGCDGGICDKIHENRVLILIDRTDSSTFKIVQRNIVEDFRKIDSLLFPCKPCTAGNFRIVEIQANCITPEVLNIGYSPLPNDVSCDIFKPIDFKMFEDKTKQSAQKIMQDASSHFGKTCLYLPLCRELSRLIDTKNEGKKIAILYSDMLENDKVSMYKDSINSSIELEKHLVYWYKESLPDLKGVEIHIVNFPRKEDTVNTEDRIIKAGRYWKEIFNKHGAIVCDQASNLNLGTTCR